MKFESKPIEEHREVPLADEGRWEDLVSRWTNREVRTDLRHGQNACYVVCVGLARERSAKEAELAEILGLVRAQGDEIVGHEVCQLKRIEPRTFVGRGACEEIAGRAAASHADMLVLDAELSPSQMRNLEEATGLSVCDREAVILNVFLRHARTRKARIQVEIAHLEYLKPRIRGVGLVMDQQAAGLMRGRGPGETASELLARQLDARLHELRKAFARLERAGDVQRRGREGCQRIALVGYTNAGKTTLMNGLTSAGLSARNMPFETLDTTSRCLTRHGGDVLLSDTVGFVRRLPARLLDSFESTLAEVREASLLALVIDASDPEWRLHLETTDNLLVRLDADTIPRLYIFNKIDRVTRAPAEEIMRQVARGNGHLAICGHRSEDLARLRAALIGSVRLDQRRVEIFVPYAAREAVAAVYAKCRVLEAEPNERGIRFRLEADARVVDGIERRVEETQR